MDNSIHAERPLLNRGPIIGAERVLTEDGALRAGDEETAAVLPEAAAEDPLTPGHLLYSVSHKS